MSSNRIQLEGGDGDAYVYCENLADAALSPGHILQLNADGEVLKHNTTGGNGLCRVAVEDALQGKTVATAYAAAALVPNHIQRRGTRFQALLASGQDISPGDPLMSNGSGCLTMWTSGSDYVVLAWADEELDLSSGSTDTLLAVRAN